MSRTHVVAAGGCAVAIAFALAGCGSSPHAGPSTKALTTTEFKAQANAICKKGNADIKAIGAGLSANSSESDVVDALDRAADRADKEAADIRKLEAPAAIAADVAAMLDSVNAATTIVRKKGIEMLQGGPDPFKDADTKAAALGLDACVSSAGT